MRPWLRVDTAVLVQYRRVTDGQTNWQTPGHSIFRASIASCGKNETGEEQIRELVTILWSQAARWGHCTMHAWLSWTSAWLGLRSDVAAAAIWCRYAGGVGNDPEAIELRRPATIDWRRCCSRWRDCIIYTHDPQYSLDELRPLLFSHRMRHAAMRPLACDMLRRKRRNVPCTCSTATHPAQYFRDKYWPSSRGAYHLTMVLLCWVITMYIEWLDGCADLRSGCRPGCCGQNL